MNHLRHGITAILMASLIFGLAAASAPTLAHHAVSTINANKRAILVGTIKSFEWKNPHGLIFLHVNAIDAKPLNEPILWIINTEPPAKLVGQGWGKQTLKSGDRISVEVSLTDAEKRIAFARTLTMVNGKSFRG